MVEVVDFIERFWPYLVALYLVLSVWASVHVVLHKQDDRAALGWFALIWMTPLLGSVLYGILGINRIARRARSLRRQPVSKRSALLSTHPPDPRAEDALDPTGLVPLSRLVQEVVDEPLLAGNRFELLENGDEAYPRMLEAIEHAERSVALMTFIFDNDSWGRRIAEALGAARRRGVEVRVLIDGAGVKYSSPTILPVLRRQGVHTSLFLPLRSIRRLPSMNLRNHRKLLVVDGSVAFTGGMNIRATCVIAEVGDRGTEDVHFRLVGPVVSQLLRTFANDWAFCAKRPLEGDAWSATAIDRDSTVGWARAIPDGPDEDHDKARWTLLGALACARHSIRIATPYFVPDEALIAALSVAALRGVRVDILLPEKNNLPYVAWASWPKLRRVVRAGCRVYRRGGRFSHAKLMVVDDAWVHFGSANWDARSLRLNFELNTEAYDERFARECASYIDEGIGRAQLLRLDEIERRPTLLKIRDGLARLLSPYL